MWAGEGESERKAGTSRVSLLLLCLSSFMSKKKKKNQLKWLCDLEINKFSKTLPVYINILNKDMELNSGQAHNLCSIKFVEWTPCKSDFNCIHSESELAHKTLD